MGPELGASWSPHILHRRDMPAWWTEIPEEGTAKAPTQKTPHEVGWHSPECEAQTHTCLYTYNGTVSPRANPRI